MNLFEILALHERRLRRVGIDAQTVRLVLFARFAGVLFPRLFDLEFLLDRRLIHFFVVLLLGYEGADLAFQVGPDLLCDLRMEPGLLVGLETERVDRVAQLPVDATMRSEDGQRGTWDEAREAHTRSRPFRSPSWPVLRAVSHTLPRSTI